MSLAIEFAPIDRFGLGAFALKALAERPHPAHLGVFMPRSAAEIAPPPEVDGALLERAELVAALADRTRARLEPRADAAVHEGIAASLGRLALEGTSVVVCGQQPGFLGGPLLDALKTLHTIRLARELERAFARPVVPLFWNHGDDHDANEVQGVHLVNRNFDVAKVGLASFGASRRALSHRPVEREAQHLAAVGAHLGELFLAGPRAQRILDLLMPRDGETLVAARTRSWLELFGAHGLLVLEPDGLRAAHGRALARLVLAHPGAQLAAANARLQPVADRVPALDPDRLPPLLFHLADGERRAARPLPTGGWRLDGEDDGAERTDEELAATVQAAPSAWSAGALLRPLVQDMLLPVAAYVGGPGELGYHARLLELRRSNGVQNTPFVLRVSGAVTTADLRDSAARLDVAIADYLRDPLPLTPKKTHKSTPLVIQTLEDTARRHRAELLELRTALGEIEPGLAHNLRRAATNGEEMVLKITSKALKIASNQLGKGRRHERRLAAYLAPLGRPQERVLGLACFLAAAGEDWLAELLGEMDPFPTEGILIHLDDLPGPRP